MMKPAFVFDGKPIQYMKEYFFPSKQDDKERLIRALCMTMRTAGRKILPHEELVKLGFSVETIGKQILQVKPTTIA